MASAIIHQLWVLAFILPSYRPAGWAWRNSLGPLVRAGRRWQPGDVRRLTGIAISRFDRRYISAPIFDPRALSAAAGPTG